MMNLEHRRPATFFVSVDVHQQHEGSTTVAGIREVLQRHQVKAMWSFEFQGSSKAINAVSATASDFGVLVSDAWATPSCERTVFARELLTRINRASELGVKPMALTLVSHDAPTHFDLLVKYQLAVIRTRTDLISGVGQALQPRLARYGIWQAEPTLVVPVGSRWSLPWTLRRLIQKAIDQGQTIHVAVNVARLMQNCSAGLSSLDYILKTAAARRDAGLLHMVSARGLLDIYGPRRERVSSRSVLRAA
jgi:hypothetical protein